jgi:hypothetical protein
MLEALKISDHPPKRQALKRRSNPPYFQKGELLSATPEPTAHLLAVFGRLGGWTSVPARRRKVAEDERNVVFSGFASL